MKNTRWKDIEHARQCMGLPEQVTRIEILEAYRRCCRDLHPDKNPGIDTSKEMAQLNMAYRTLIDYIDTYKIELSPNEMGMTDAEWWIQRFGQDPIWVGDHKED